MMGTSQHTGPSQPGTSALIINDNTADRWLVLNGQLAEVPASCHLHANLDRNIAILSKSASHLQCDACVGVLVKQPVEQVPQVWADGHIPRQLQRLCGDGLVGSTQGGGGRQGQLSAQSGVISC
jgi:hypothetical protein